MADVIDTQVPEPITSRDSEDLVFARFYDFFKHMTGVALVSIGGVLSLSSGTNILINSTTLFLIITSLGISGLIAVLMLSMLTAIGLKDASYKMTVRRFLLSSQNGTVLLMLFGLGVFTGAFLQGLKVQ